jgi:hypothetical protein
VQLSAAATLSWLASERANYHGAMSLPPDSARVLASTVEGWFENFAGTSALDVARQLDLEHEVVLAIFEQLVATGHGTMNADVTLLQLSFNPEKPDAGLKQEEVTTHIFFPSKAALRRAFYASDRPEQRLPEYQTRLHLGANQIGLAFFREEVLSKYFNHPELYEIRDSLPGGYVQPADDAPEEYWLDVKYGKCRLKSGRVAVTAIFKDLAHMSASEQRYWHSFEIENPEPDGEDEHFNSFLRRTYEGSWAAFEDPIERLSAALGQVNAAFGDNAFYSREKNIHLQLPVEETYKSYCDSASELFKLVGPDNLKQSGLKSALVKRFGLSAEQLVHPESKRPLSGLQMLARLETALGVPSVVTERIDQVKALRVAADHKVLEADKEVRSFSREFAQLCTSVAQALEQLAAAAQPSPPTG